MSVLITGVFLVMETITEVIFCDIYMEHRFGLKKTIIMCAVQILFLIMAFSFGIFVLGSIQKAILTVAVFAITILIVYRCTVLQGIFFAMTFYAMVNAFDYSVLLVTAICTGNSVSAIRAGIVAFLLLGSISKLLFFTVVYIFNRIKMGQKQKLDLSCGYWFCVIAIPLYAIANFTISVQDTLHQKNPAPFVLWNGVALLAIQIILIYQLDKINAEKQERTQLQALKKESALRMENVSQLMAAYEIQRRAVHDFYNHLSVLKDLIDLKKIHEAQKYIDALSLTKDIVIIVDTGDPVVDAVLNEKYTCAQNRQVALRFKVNNLTNVRMERKELVTLIANLLDNAIEACERTNGEKIIVFKFLTTTSGKAVLSVRNTSDKVIINNNGGIETNKEDVVIHGFGLRNIMYVLKQNHCPYAMNWQDGWFTFVTELDCNRIGEMNE